MGISCCVQRDSSSAEPTDVDDSYQGQKQRQESWCSVPDAAEEYSVFFECEDGEGSEMIKKISSGRSPNDGRTRIARGSTWYTLRTPMEMVPEDSTTWTRKDSEYEPLLHQPCPYESSVDAVTKEVRDHWNTYWEKSKSSKDDPLKAKLEEGFPELDEWTTPDTVRRYLRAMKGNVKEATQLLIKAIQCRVQKRELFKSLACDVLVDCRVIGRDKFRRPVVYMCAKAQQVPLKQVMPQVILAFEAAVRLSPEDGQVCLVCDMHGFTASLNMEASAITELGAVFGSVFAERFNFIMLVDFSFIAQGVWSMGKGMLSEATQNKVAFVSEKKARGICKDRFSEPTCERVLGSFDINRDKKSTPEQRANHAIKTSICDVPLGVNRHLST